MTNTAPVAVISGASRGVGRALALRLAADGYDIAGTWNRNEAAAQQVRSEIESIGRRATMYCNDVADGEATAGLVEAILADHGRVDTLVHNAGIASRGRFVADTTSVEIARVMGVHAMGAFHLCSALAPTIRLSDRGSVVLISSTATSYPGAGGAPYMMGKAALEALGTTLALEERTHGTRVNVIAPGLIVTEMGDRLAHALTGAENAAALDEKTPFGRVTRPEDIADLVSFLASDAARQITGQRIEIHGGCPELVH
ncbi:hypothetical protein A0W34_30470 (plasmid) [Rhodococcus sp. BH4]|uniref:SDR family NAD(P)-dependent oxidoreductase n=1 Tax=Rhodococcus sp. BH4 TaxID=1807790 RepID=UPI0009C39444|nr:SDR family oxidoreductase [Rhodococcus sp. BH4]ARE37843.1 hypothetical protein A0W34_30470 [Rhodococcus sp. BH4]